MEFFSMNGVFYFMSSFDKMYLNPTLVTFGYPKL